MVYTDPVNGAVIQLIIPAGTTLASHFLGLERIDIKTRIGIFKVLGISSAIAGALTMVGFDKIFVTSKSTDNLWANVFFLGNALAYTFYIFEQKKLLNDYPTLVVTFWSHVFGLIFSVFPTMFFWNNFAAWQFHYGAVIALLYAGFISSGIGFLLMAWGNKRVSPVLTTAFIAFQPVGTASLSAVFLGTEFSLRELVGAVFTAIGLFAICWAKAKESRSQLTVTEPIASNTEALK
jgi:drug/metabolite transporter (DMT)-like permease